MQKTRTYLGNGSQIKDFEMLSINLDVEKILANAYEYEGRKYITLTVSKRKEPDNYGKTHMVYVDNIVKDVPKKTRSRKAKA